MKQGIRAPQVFAEERSEEVTMLAGDWRPFVYGGIGSVAAEFGKHCNLDSDKNGRN